MAKPLDAVRSMVPPDVYREVMTANQQDGMPAVKGLAGPAGQPGVKGSWINDIFDNIDWKELAVNGGQGAVDWFQANMLPVIAKSNPYLGMLAAFLLDSAERWIQQNTPKTP